MYVSLTCTQRIDMERMSREAMDPYLRHKPRLIVEEELPAWLLRDEDEVRKNKFLLLFMYLLLKFPSHRKFFFSCFFFYLPFLNFWWSGEPGIVLYICNVSIIEIDFKWTNLIMNVHVPFAPPSLHTTSCIGGTDSL